MSPKKVLFKDFANENRSKLSEKYPFLTNQQIQAKLKHSWKKACQENKEVVKINRSPRKTLSNKKSDADQTSPRNGKRQYRMTESPYTNSYESQSLGSPDIDSGSWYDETANDSFKSDTTTDNEDIKILGVETDLLTKTRENLTEETVQNVLEHRLNIETNKDCTGSESSITEKEKVVSDLFHPLKNEEMCRVQRARLLASEEKEGESNFNVMFDDKEKIFL